MSVSAESRFEVGNTMSRGFAVYLKNFVPFSVLSLIFLSPTYIHALASGGVDPLTGSGAGDFTVGGIAVTIAQLLLTYVLMATLAYGTFQELRGRHTTLGDCIGRGLSLLFPTLGVAILAAMAVGVGVILLIIPGIIAATMLWVAIPVAVVERPGVMASLHRSRHLTKGYRWHVLGIIIIFLIINFVAVFIGAFVGSLASMATGSTTVNLLFESIVSALLTGLYAVIVSVGYHDLRVTKEGIDINQIAAVFD